MPTKDLSAIAAAKLGAGCLLTDLELAALTGLAQATLRNWRALGVGPAWVRLGGRAIRYTAEAVRAFIEAGEREAAA